MHRAKTRSVSLHSSFSAVEVSIEQGNSTFNSNTHRNTCFDQPKISNRSKQNQFASPVHNYNIIVSKVYVFVIALVSLEYPIIVVGFGIHVNASPQPKHLDIRQKRCTIMTFIYDSTLRTRPFDRPVSAIWCAVSLIIHLLKF